MVITTPKGTTTTTGTTRGSVYYGNGEWGDVFPRSWTNMPAGGYLKLV